LLKKSVSVSLLPATMTAAADFLAGLVATKP
jgi:hypothetical protein